MQIDNDNANKPRKNIQRLQIDNRSANPCSLETHNKMLNLSHSEKFKSVIDLTAYLSDWKIKLAGWSVGGCRVTDVGFHPSRNAASLVPKLLRISRRRQQSTEYGALLGGGRPELRPSPTRPASRVMRKLYPPPR